MLASLYPVRDMRLSGQVIHTGNSSMEVAVRMEAVEKDGSEETIMLGRFCMVARDAWTGKSKKVNPLILETPEDRTLFNIGESTCQILSAPDDNLMLFFIVHKDRRRSIAVRSLSRVPPTSSESEELHSLYLKYGKDSHGGITLESPETETVWMGDTRLEKTMVMFPQERK